MNTRIEVENMKCGGCANTIKNGLKSIEGVSSVEADNKTGLVDVSYSNSGTLDRIKEKLISLGYPEKRHSLI